MTGVSKKKFYLETFGCKFNQADSEIIRSFLNKKFRETKSLNRADFVILNSCGVLKKTELKVFKRAKYFKNKGKKVIIAGCLPLICLKKCRVFADGVVGPQSINHINRVVFWTLKGRKISFLKSKPLDKICFYPLDIQTQKLKNNCSLIVPVAEGCLGNCSYCATKLARKSLKSFSLKEIVQKIKMGLSLGFKEFHLTAQDLAIYGLDKNKTLLASLLKAILNLKAEFRVKLGMLEPYFFKKQISDLLPLIKDERIYNFFHIPLQSGSNAVLKQMKRKYKVSDFLKIIEKLEKEFSHYLLAIDVIVGFPTEKEKDFNQTLKIISQVKPEIIHINRFSSRPNTEASLLKDISEKIKKERSRLVFQLGEKIKLKKNRNYLGKEYDVLVVRKGKNNTFLVRNNSGKAIIVSQAKVGKFYKVKITGFTSNYLVGKVRY